MLIRFARLLLLCLTAAQAAAQTPAPVETPVPAQTPAPADPAPAPAEQVPPEISLPPPPAPSPPPSPPAPLPLANAPTEPSLSVAQVRLTSGQRVSRLLGATVTDDKGQKLGTVDDLVLGQGDRPTLIVLQVGGLLGVGGKLIAMPFAGMQVQGNQIVLPGADPKALAAAPAFSYGN